MNDLDIEDRLRRTYRAVAEHTTVTRDLPTRATPTTVDGDGSAPIAPVHDIEVLPAPTRAGPGRRVPRRPAVRWAAAAAAAAAVAAAGAGLAVRGPSAEDDPLATGPDVGSWERLADPPSNEFGQGQVWTGSELVRFGGAGGADAVGADAYDPATGRWRRLRDLPAEVAGASVGVWTGHEVLAFPVQRSGVAAAYDPATDRWRLITDSRIPFLNVEAYAFRVGDQALLAGYPASEGELADVRGHPGRATLYDPAAGDWRELPEAPQPIAPSGVAVWTGREPVFVTDEADIYATDRGMRTLALDPAAGTWRELPGPPLELREVPFIAWTGSEVVVAGGVRPPDDADPDGAPLGDAAALDPATGRWRVFPAPPAAVFGDDIAAMPSVATVGRHVVALNTGDAKHRPLLLDTAARSWDFGAPPPADLRSSSGWAATSTGERVVAVAGTRTYAFTPPRHG